MKTVIWKEKRVEISIADIDDEERGCNVRGSASKMLKHLYRYEHIITTKAELGNVLLMALKGCSCKEDHLDVSQRLALYHFIKDKDFSDSIDAPYLEQFLKDTKKNFPVGTC